jgi:phosphatidylserine/phosphatidylglycerophosphate/cardiolipin synthase-like enzyme
MFYLSEETLVRAVRDAAYSGASVRIILDRNRDAFGRTKIGVPNRPVAAALVKYAAEHRLDLQVRWADTHGEQFHAKAMSLCNPHTGKREILCGSANWTRRNVGDLNLEADAYVIDTPWLTDAFSAHFDAAWDNADGLERTAAYEEYAERGWRLTLKGWMGKLQEATGLSTF